MSKTYDIDTTSILNRNAVTFELECEPEDDGPEGHFASGDDAWDKETCETIRADLESGNEWAWCRVKVTASLPELNLSASDYLGGCSYKSRADFKQDAYYADMCNTAFEELNAKAYEIIEKARIAGNIFNR